MDQEETTPDVELVDLAEHARSGTKPPRAHRYRIVVDGGPHVVHQHEMSVVGVLDLVGKDPDEFRLEAVLAEDSCLLLPDDGVIRFNERGVIEFRTRHRHKSTASDDEQLKLEVVVNGDSVHLHVGPETSLGAVVAQALELAKAVGRPAADWELKTEQGSVLDQALTVAQADVRSGALLFLSLKAGAAGDSSGELLVDPAVSRAKFETDLAQYRFVEEPLNRRGQWLVKADFPEVFVIFGAASASVPQLLAFGVVIDFTNYDFWAPSVRLVDPFTLRPYRKKEMPGHAWLNRIRLPTADEIAAGQTGPMFDQLMQAHLPDDIPFLCLPGVREYHQHPAHTGDDWLLRRAQGEGTMYHLLDVIYQHGPRVIGGIGLQIVLNFQTDLAVAA
jgi:hypothetical protein